MRTRVLKRSTQSGVTGVTRRQGIRIGGFGPFDDVVFLGSDDNISEEIESVVMEESVVITYGNRERLCEAAQKAAVKFEEFSCYQIRGEKMSDLIGNSNLQVVRGVVQGLTWVAATADAVQGATASPVHAHLVMQFTLGESKLVLVALDDPDSEPVQAVSTSQKSLVALTAYFTSGLHSCTLTRVLEPLLSNAVILGVVTNIHRATDMLRLLNAANSTAAKTKRSSTASTRVSTASSLSSFAERDDDDEPERTRLSSIPLAIAELQKDLTDRTRDNENLMEALEAALAVSTAALADRDREAARADALEVTMDDLRDDLTSLEQRSVHARRLSRSRQSLVAANFDFALEDDDCDRRATLTPIPEITDDDENNPPAFDNLASDLVAATSSWFLPSNIDENTTTPTKKQQPKQKNKKTPLGDWNAVYSTLFSS